MKRKLLIVFTSSLFVLSVVGCGKSQPSTVSSESSSVSSEPAPNSSVAPSSTSIAPQSSSSVQPSSSSSMSSSSSSSVDPIPEEDPVFSKGILKAKKLKTFNFSKAHTVSEEDREKIEKYDIGERNFYYVDGFQYDYYLTLDDYFDIIKTNAKEGYKFNISNENYIYAIDVTDPQNKSICYTTFDIEKRVIDYKGFMESAFNVAPETDYSTYSIYMDVKYEDTYSIPSDQRIRQNSFKYIDYDFYKQDNKVYFPLSLLNAHFNKDFDINFTFDANCMYFYDDANQIKTFFFMDKPIEGMVEDNIYDWVTASFTDQNGEVLMPVEMARSSRNAFYFVMDNYYGIRTTRGIGSYAEFYETHDFAKKFLSPKGAERGFAYATAVNMLDDQHTALGLGGLGLSVWGEREGFANAIPSKLKTERNALQNALTNERLKAFGLENSKALRSIEKYSADGKTAYVYLNEFAHVSDGLKKENGQIVSRKSEEELAENESYYNLLHNIKRIEAKGGVENIVIDMSTNGGGTLGVLDKIATLFAKTNGFETYTFNDKTGCINTTKTYIDTNYDGKFDDTDVYGNKFKFYLLTSPCSFSCGNALPFFCGLAGTATVVGQRSGGGECSTTTSQFELLKTFTHSSNTHIMSYKTEIKDGKEVKTQVFAEGGADISGFYEFGYEKFYDFQYIADMIKENQEREAQ